MSLPTDVIGMCQTCHCQVMQSEGYDYEGKAFHHNDHFCLLALLESHRKLVEESARYKVESTLLDIDFLIRWHKNINNLSVGKTWIGWRYLARHMAEELPRLVRLFAMERLGTLPKIHQQCSQSKPVALEDNHLSCCLGTECRKCEHLLGLKNETLSGEELDLVFAWSCIAHIAVSGDMVDSSEGFILTESDKEYWSEVYSSLASSSMEPEEGDNLNET
jgi:hypothetical protein